MGIDAEYRHMVSPDNEVSVDRDIAAMQAVAVASAAPIVARRVLIVGGGPAGLFAAEHLASLGHAVTLVERMPSVGRKLLMAGRGGLNLTHSEGLKDFLGRYGASAQAIVGAIHGFRPNQLILWAHDLGQQTFVGSSGRVFPKAMKASPLLRAWLQRLAAGHVEIVTGERWLGWDDAGHALFQDEKTHATRTRTADATILALGGASWPRLGSDGSWTDILAARGIARTPWHAANAGVHIAWSPFMREKFAGTPLKRLGVTVGGSQHLGEAMVTRDGLEGGVVYAVGAELRAAMAAGAKPASLSLDLKPGMTVAELTKALARPRGKQSMANHLRKSVGMPPVMVALLHENLGRTLPGEPEVLAQAIKNLPFPVLGFAGLQRAISSAGGIALDEIDARFMLRKLPGVFVAGEMLDWDAPTGGYLLQASFATGKAAALGATAWLASMVHVSPATGEAVVSTAEIASTDSAPSDSSS